MKNKVDNCGELIRVKYKLDPQQYTVLRKQILETIDEADQSDSTIDEIINKVTDRKLIDIQQTKKQNLLNKKKFLEVSEYLKQEGFKGDMIAAVRSLIEPSVKHDYKGIGSLWYGKKVYQSRMQQIIDSVANKHNAMERLTSGEMSKDLHEIVIDGKRDGYDTATLAVGDAIKKLNDEVHAQKKKLGVELGYIENYLDKQSHNAETMFEMGEAPWTAWAKKTFNFKKMGFYTQEGIDDYLTNFYHGRIRELGQLRGTKIASDEMKQIEKTKFAERMGRSRNVVFEDGAAAYEYSKAMNPDGNLYKNIISGIDRDASQMAAMEIFGPNFKMTFKEMLRVAKAEDFSKQIPGTKFDSKFDQQTKNLETLFKVASEGEFQGKMNWIARGGNALRQLANMSKLSNALVTTLTDLSFSSGVISPLTGKNYYHELGLVTKDSFKFFTSTEARLKGADFLGVFANEVNVLTQNTRFGEYGQMHDWLSRGHDFIMRLTGLSRQAVSMKIAEAGRLAESLADNVNIEFKDHPARKSLLKFGIDEKEWKLMQSAVAENEDGRKYITPHSIMDIPDEGFKLATADEINAAKLKLSNNLREWLTFYSERGSPTAGVNQFAFRNAFDRNSAHGQVFSMLFQFKSFMWSAFDTMNVVARSGDTKVDRYKNVANTVFASTILGAVAMSARDLLLNKVPEVYKLIEQTSKSGMSDKDNQLAWRKYAMKSFLQGGTGGIYADFLFDDHAKSYISLSGKVAGPVIGGMGDDFVSFISGIYYTDWEKDDARKKFYRDTLVALEKNSPTIPFTKAIINQNVFDSVHSFFNTQRKPREQSLFDRVVGTD